jgi:hypothetical protein
VSSTWSGRLVKAFFVLSVVQAQAIDDFALQPRSRLALRLADPVASVGPADTIFVVIVCVEVPFVVLLDVVVFDDLKRPLGEDDPSALGRDLYIGAGGQCLAKAGLAKASPVPRCRIDLRSRMQQSASALTSQPARTAHTRATCTDQDAQAQHARSECLSPLPARCTPAPGRA